jgi:hypothetical protein
MKRRAADELAAVHQHRFAAVNPYQPEADRCECGMFRYELMGPFARRKARMTAYYAPWPVFSR